MVPIWPNTGLWSTQPHCYTVLYCTETMSNFLLMVRMCPSLVGGGGLLKHLLTWRFVHRIINPLRQPDKRSYLCQDLQSVPLTNPGPHIVNNCRSQRHVLKSGIIPLLSQDTVNTKTIVNKQLPNADLFASGCPGSRHYRLQCRWCFRVVWYLWQ